jgi:fumarate hydratase class II
LAGTGVRPVEILVSTQARSPAGDEPRDRPLWGRETAAALENFQISGRPMPLAVVHWLARLKAAAARVHGELGELDAGLADAIATAADAVADGDHDDQFPVDVFQTGSGTSTNMNVNEVIATLTDGRAHPNDDVNRGQSSNDTVPTAVRLAACEAIGSSLLPALAELSGALSERAEAFAAVVKPGRTHLMDAVPVLLGDEFAGYAIQLDEAAEHLAETLPRLVRVPLGGTAVGNGLGARPELAASVLDRLAAGGRLPVAPTSPPGRMARQGAHDALVATSGALVVVATALTKICNDLRWMASGPDTGLAEIRLPELQKGSSIMPGKVNPVVCEAVIQVATRVLGNHTVVAVAGSQGNFELNVTIPVIADALLESIGLLAAGSSTLSRRCVSGIEVDAERCRELAERSLAIATGLNAALGYERVEAIVRTAGRTGRTIREVALAEGVDAAVLDRHLDLDRIARGERPPA